MSENKLSDIIKTSLDGVKDLTDMNTVIGNAISTPNGVTVIPISKVNVGLINGGIDFGTKKMLQNQNFGCGGGTGMSITPLGFLVIGRDADVNLIPLDSSDGGVQKAFDLIEQAPELIKKIRSSLS